MRFSYWRGLSQEGSGASVCHLDAETGESLVDKNACDVNIIYH